MSIINRPTSPAEEAIMGGEIPEDMARNPYDVLHVMAGRLVFNNEVEVQTDDNGVATFIVASEDGPQALPIREYAERTFHGPDIDDHHYEWIEAGLLAGRSLLERSTAMA